VRNLERHLGERRRLEPDRVCVRQPRQFALKRDEGVARVLRCLNEQARIHRRDVGLALVVLRKRCRARQTRRRQRRAMQAGFGIPPGRGQIWCPVSFSAV
jgi:hypothetical protein